MKKNESLLTGASSAKNSFNINKTFADESLRIRVFLHIAD